MIEFDRALLGEFAAEILEHVKAGEDVLVRAGTEPASEQDVHLLFRSVHSVKGLARVLAATDLERVAHASESLLAGVREGRRALDRPTQDVLLRALDAFKEARARLLAGKEFHADESLVRALSETPAPAGARPEAPAAEASEGAAPAQGDLYFDEQTLIALAELFEELLPGIAGAVASAVEGAESLSPQTFEEIDALEFACSRVGMAALEGAIRALGDPARPAEFARCLCLVERLAQVLERDCGVTDAVRLSRPWLAPALLSALDERRWADVGWIFRALLPQSPFVPLLPQVLSAACPSAIRQAALGLLADALRAEFAPGAPSSTDVAALAADKVRDLLARPHQLPPEALAWLDGRRLDVDRFRTPPPLLAARLQAIAADPGYQIYEVVLPSPGSMEADDLAALAEALGRGLDPLLTETLVVDGAATLVLLLAVSTDEPEEKLRERVAAIAGPTPAATLRKLDQQPGDAHFRIKPRTAAVEGIGSSDLQVRVPVALLDSMFGRVGQFFSVTTRFNALVFDSDIQDILSELSDYSVLRAPHLLPKVDRLVRQQNEYATLEAETHRLISVIHEMTLGLRVIPIDTLFSRFPRMVRDLAQRQGKQVRLDAQSNGIRVDNGMLELLADPLVHMVRNCIDHGIETPDTREKSAKPRTAKLTLNAEQRGNHIVIEVGDDGRGIDLDRVLQTAIARDLVDAATAATLTEDQIARFIFAPGLSTSERVTDTSGRGVGMDVALVNVTKLGGVLDILTHRGQGTTFRIDIPLSKAIQSMLLAETGVQTVAFPDRMVVECVVAHASDVQSVNGQRSILLREHFLPIFRLVELLKLPGRAGEASEARGGGDDGELSIVVCELEGRRVGFEVHRIRRRTDLLIQEMHPRIAKLPGIGGISTLGTDKIVVVVDPEGLFDLARRFAVFGLRTHAVRVAEGMF